MLPKNRDKIIPTPTAKRGLNRETADLFKYSILGIIPEDNNYANWLRFKADQQPKERKERIREILREITSTDTEPAFFPYQRAWIADESVAKIGVKSRRIGLTWCQACDDVLTASLERSQGGANGLYISTKQDLTREYIDTCKFWAETLLGFPCVPQEEDLIDPDGEGFKALTLSFPSGFKIYALSSNPANLRGLQGNVTIDEAAFHKSLPELLKAAMAMRIWGGKIRIISTHKGRENNFNKLLRNDSDKYSVHTIPIDIAVDQGLARRILMLTNQVATLEAQKAWLEGIVKDNGEFAAEELYCQPSADVSAYFSQDVVVRATKLEFRILKLSCDDELVKLPEREQEEYIDSWLINNVEPIIKELVRLQYNCYAGLDFGRSRDLTILSILLSKDGNEIYEVPLIVELRNCPFKRQAQICEYILRRFRRFRKAAFDATGNGSYLAEEMALKFGHNKIEQVKFSQQEYLSRFPRYKSLLESGKLLIPYSEDLVDDHMLVQLINGVPKPPTNAHSTGLDGFQRHGDGAISLMLAASCLPIIKNRRCLPPGSISFKQFT